MNRFLKHLLIFIILIATKVSSQDISIIDSKVSSAQKNALIILNGFGDSKKNRNIQKEFFQNRGYDLFIPVYVDRKSIDSSIVNFSSFYYSNDLDSYREVHIISYIVGS